MSTPLLSSDILIADCQVICRRCGKERTVTSAEIKRGGWLRCPSCEEAGDA